MTWIDWVTVACVVFVALLTIVEWELLRYQQRLRVKADRVDLDHLKPGPAAPTAEPGIKAEASTPTEPGEERSVPPVDDVRRVRTDFTGDPPADQDPPPPPSPNRIYGT